MDADHVRRAAQAAGIDEPAIARLSHALQVTPDRERPLAGLDDLRPQFDRQTLLSRATQVLAWVGMLLIIGSHAWWATTAGTDGAFGRLALVTAAYMVVFLVGAELARARGLGAISAGLGAAVAFYTPLLVYALQRRSGTVFENTYDGFYPYISGDWVWMEVAAIAVAIAVLVRYRRPFALFPLCLFTLFIAMDGGQRSASSAAGSDEYADVSHPSRATSSSPVP